MELTLSAFLKDSYIAKFPYLHPGCFIHCIKTYVSLPASRCFLKTDNKINKRNINKPFINQQATWFKPTLFSQCFFKETLMSLSIHNLIKQMHLALSKNTQDYAQDFTLNSVTIIYWT